MRRPVPGSSRHSIAGTTVTGIRARNEDAILGWSGSVSGATVSLLAVADGMGGQSAGDKASELAILALKKTFLTDLQNHEAPPNNDRIRRLLIEAYEAANLEIRREVDRDASLSGMGTTLVATVVIDNKAVVANVGDSRAYLIGRDEISCLTRDHSIVAEGVRDGTISEAEARSHPFKQALSRSLDGTPGVEVDLFPEMSEWIDLSGGGFILLCSDGLTGSAFDPIAYETDLFEHLLHSKDVVEACETLVELALQRGSKDNVSVGVVEIGRVERLSGALPAARPAGLRASSARTTAGRRRTPFRMAWVLIAVLAIALVSLSGTLIWLELGSPGSSIAAMPAPEGDTGGGLAGTAASSDLVPDVEPVVPPGAEEPAAETDAHEAGEADVEAEAQVADANSAEAKSKESGAENDGHGSETDSGENEPETASDHAAQPADTAETVVEHAGTTDQVPLQDGLRESDARGAERNSREGQTHPANSVEADSVRSEAPDTSHVPPANDKNDD